MGETWLLVTQLLVLLTAANGAPVLLTRWLGDRWAWPLDGGIVLADGRRALGRSKTLRGFVAALVATGLAAWLMALPWGLGIAFAAASMLGDMTSSFVKRRLGIESSGRAMGLDQIPEALLPLLVCYRALELDPLTVVATVALFGVGSLLISPVMFRLGIRGRPY
jgi:CDP-diglyceride synthetase